MRKTLTFLGGLLAGGLVGGLTGILMAPSSGEKLQQEIKDYVEHLIEEGKEAAEARRLQMEAELEAFKQGRPIIKEKPVLD
jgi:gas vesicle protein